MTRRLRGSAVVPGSRGAVRPGTDEGDFADAAAVLPLNMAREHQRLVQIQRRGAGLRRRDGVFDFLVVGFERSGRRGHAIGAHQHHAVAHRQGLEILPRPVARHIHQACDCPDAPAIQAEVSSTIT